MIIQTMDEDLQHVTNISDDHDIDNDRICFIVDTNVFLQDADAVFSFGDNDIVIPMIVLEEIDRKKDRFDTVGLNARKFCRILDDLRITGSLRDGIELEQGGRLRVLTSDEFIGVLPDELNDDHPDNMIISVAIGVRDGEGVDVKVITRDINMRIKCNIVGVECEDYNKYRVARDTSDIYTGVKRIELPKHISDTLRNNRSVNISKSDSSLFNDVHPNQFIINTSKNDDNGVYRLDPGDDNTLWRVSNTETRDVWGITARNLEQKLAFKLLLDDRIQLVTLVGAAGTGKTCLAVAAALEKIFEERRYNKLIISRPIQPVGRDMGYLPGTKQEKMDPWIQPIYDNIEFLLGRHGKGREMFDMWIEKGLIEIEGITYMRGRSLANAFIIIDESQNLSVHELKTIITRVGEGTKIVLTGDIEQIDNNLVDPLTNGLTYAIEKFKSETIAGHMTLLVGERSRLATLGAQIL